MVALIRWLIKYMICNCIKNVGCNKCFVIIGISQSVRILTFKQNYVGKIYLNNDNNRRTSNHLITIKGRNL